MRRAPSSCSASSSAPEVVSDGISPACVIAAHIARSPATPPTKLPDVQAYATTSGATALRARTALSSVSCSLTSRARSRLTSTGTNGVRVRCKETLSGTQRHSSRSSAKSKGATTPTPRCGLRATQKRDVHYRAPIHNGGLGPLAEGKRSGLQCRDVGTDAGAIPLLTTVVSVPAWSIRRPEATSTTPPTAKRTTFRIGFPPMTRPGASAGRPRPTLLVLDDDPPPRLDRLAGRARILACDESLARRAPARAPTSCWSGTSPPHAVRAAWPGEGPRPRWVHTASAGVDQLMCPELAASDTVVTNARGSSTSRSPSTSPRSSSPWPRTCRGRWELQRQRRWRHRETQRVAGTRACVVGSGPIGRTIARTLKALDRDDGLVGRTARTGIHGADELDRLLPHADWVVVARRR